MWLTGAKVPSPEERDGGGTLRGEARIVDVGCGVVITIIIIVVTINRRRKSLARRAAQTPG